MSKLLQIVMDRRKQMNESWMDSFEKFNIDDDVKFLYHQSWSLEFANRVFAFIIMAYDKDSGWIDIHKNRLDNKRKIMSRLGGDINNKEVIHVVENSSIPANNLKAWFMAYQRDWRWDTIMTCFDYHAEQMAFGGFKTMDELDDTSYRQDGDDIIEEKIVKRVPIDALVKGNREKGSVIDIAITRRRTGEELLEEIKKEFSSLDTILEKEGLMKITEAHDPGSWEQFIKRIKATE